MGGGSPVPPRNVGFLGLTRKNVGFLSKSPKAKILGICISVLKDFLLEITFLKLQNTNIFLWQSVFLTTMYLPDPKSSQVFVQLGFLVNSGFCWTQVFCFLVDRRRKNTGIESRFMKCETQSKNFTDAKWPRKSIFFGCFYVKYYAEYQSIPLSLPPHLIHTLEQCFFYFFEKWKKNDPQIFSPAAGKNTSILVK